MRKGKIEKKQEIKGGKSLFLFRPRFLRFFGRGLLGRFGRGFFLACRFLLLVLAENFVPAVGKFFARTCVNSVAGQESSFASVS